MTHRDDDEIGLYCKQNRTTLILFIIFWGFHLTLTILLSVLYRILLMHALIAGRCISTSAWNRGKVLNALLTVTRGKKHENRTYWLRVNPMMNQRASRIRWRHQSLQPLTSSQRRCLQVQSNVNKKLRGSQHRRGSLVSCVRTAEEVWWVVWEQKRKSDELCENRREIVWLEFVRTEEEVYWVVSVRLDTADKGKLMRVMTSLPVRSVMTLLLCTFSLYCQDHYRLSPYICLSCKMMCNCKAARLR